MSYLLNFRCDGAGEDLTVNVKCWKKNENGQIYFLISFFPAHRNSYVQL